MQTSVLVCRQFFDGLIEEPDQALIEAGAQAGQGFVKFLQTVQEEVQGLLKE